jgi:hypothetical protein
MPRKVSSETMARLIAEKKVPRHYAVAKADGNDPVQAWIHLLPAWQSDRATRIDAVVTKAMPNVHKAVKWHGLWYGVPGKSWYLAISAFKAHLKLVFFDGAHLLPLPPVAMKQAPARALDLREADALDEKTLAGWVKQARQLPGWGTA